MINIRRGNYSAPSEYYRYQWYNVTETQVTAITGCTTRPGEVYEIPVSILPSGIQSIPGIQAAYVSAALTSFEVPGNMKAFCEVVALRKDENIVKAYNWIFASTGTEVYMFGPERHFPGHHITFGNPIQINNLFGHVNPPGTFSAPANED